MRDLFGASKLVWGSDMPNLERFCTYRQCVDYVRKHCPFLTREPRRTRCWAETPRSCSVCK